MNLLVTLEDRVLFGVVGGGFFSSHKGVAAAAFSFSLLLQVLFVSLFVCLIYHILSFSTYSTFSLSFFSKLHTLVQLFVSHSQLYEGGFWYAVYSSLFLFRFV